jgi:hypothetical protein
MWSDGAASRASQFAGCAAASPTKGQSPGLRGPVFGGQAPCAPIQNCRTKGTYWRGGQHLRGAPVSVGACSPPLPPGRGAVLKITAATRRRCRGTLGHPQPLDRSMFRAQRGARQHLPRKVGRAAKASLRLPQSSVPPRGDHGGMSGPAVGFGRVVALCYRSSTSYQIHEYIRCFSF